MPYLSSSNDSAYSSDSECSPSAGRPKFRRCSTAHSYLSLEKKAKSSFRTVSSKNALYFSTPLRTFSPTIPNSDNGDCNKPVNRRKAFDSQRFSYEDFDFVTRKTWTQKKETVVKGPYEYIASEPGKEFRTQLLKAFNAWLQVPEESLAIIAEVVRMLHTASLIIDDVQDGSQLRRGKPVAHNIFGVAQTINSGNYVYFLALNELQKLRNSSAAIEVYTSEMLHLHRGQGMDLYWRDVLECPEEDEYLEMVSNKTGGLFRIAIRLMQAESPRNIDCMPLVNLLGLAFQIADDYKNLSNLDYTLLKGFCEDLTEGKFSFPVIHSIRTVPESKELLNILKQKPTDVEIKKYAVRYLEKTGSLEYTREVIQNLTDRARVVTDIIDAGRGESKGILMILDKLAAK